MKRRYFAIMALTLVLVSSLIVALAKPSSTITINVTPTTVKVGSNVTISGYISPVVVGVDVTIYYRPVNGTWALLAQVTTDAEGRYTKVWNATEIGTFELKSSWAGNEVLEGAESSIVTVTVEEGEPSVRDYDPWCDINDDGKIDIKDIATVAIKYGTTGTPINKTVLLYNVNDTFTQLLSKIAELEANLAILNATKLGEPDYDSDWQTLSKGGRRQFTHNLGTTDVLVYLIGKYSDIEEPYIHQIDYGGEVSGLNEWGAWWEDLTETTITVHRRDDDGMWNWVRVMIWEIP